MKYQEEKLINLLLYLINEELENEKDYNYCEDEDYIEDLINAKVWLMRKKKLMPIIINNIMEEDVNKYLARHK